MTMTVHYGREWHLFTSSVTGHHYCNDDDVFDDYDDYDGYNDYDEYDAYDDFDDNCGDYDEYDDFWIFVFGGLLSCVINIVWQWYSYH